LATGLAPGVRLHTLGRHRRFELTPLRRFSRMVREERADLVQAHSRSTFSLLALLKALGWLRVPIVLHDHYGSIELDASVPLWFRFAGRFLLDHYVGVYDKLGTWAQTAGIPRDRIDVIGNALDLSRVERADKLDLHQAFGLQPGPLLGVVVAGIRPDKGIDVLLNALALGKLPRPLRILVIGGASDGAYVESCRALAKTSGLDDTVLFVGKRTDVPAIIKGADFALMPSRSESGPLVLIEYMMAGLPFVSTLVGDIARLAEREGLREFVAPDNPVAFREAMDGLLMLPPADWQQRAQAGRSVALERFNISKVMPKWFKVYDKVLAGRGR
jgi:glycosyltransferase involved in cell wall biosynthesis